MDDIRSSEEVRLDALGVQWGLSCIDNDEYRRAQEELNKLYADILRAMSRGEVYGHFC